MTVPTPDLHAVATRAMTAAMCPGTRVVWAEVVDAVLAAVAAPLYAEAVRLEAADDGEGSASDLWIAAGVRHAAHLLHPTAVDAPPGGPAVPPAAEQAESVPEEAEADQGLSWSEAANVTAHAAREQEARRTALADQEAAEGADAQAELLAERDELRTERDKARAHIGHLTQAYMKVVSAREKAEAERDRLVDELRRLKASERMARHHAARVDADIAESDARLAAALASVARLEAVATRHAVDCRFPDEAQGKRDRPHVRVDPLVRFGEPVVRGISCDAIASMVWAGEDIPTVCGEYGLTRGQVLVACWFLAVHGAKKWRKRWIDWAVDGDWLACVVDFDTVADPPSKGDDRG